ncbi:MAG: hypothetical protein HYZ84_06705 [Candidatus Omnitrophica bacterium]|nr:hypothetical protein [Candidatus Omnitrophota bacterium]
MDITRMLLRKKTTQLRNDFTELRRSIARHPYEEAKNLSIIVQVKAEETDILFYLVENLEVIEGNFEMSDLEDNLNRLRRAFHSTSRQWQSLHTKNTRREEQPGIAA